MGRLPQGLSRGPSPVVQWLRRCTFNTGGASLIPGWGTKTSHATRHRQGKKASWVGRGLLVRAGEKSDVTVVTGGDSRVKGPCREPGGGCSLLSRLRARAPRRPRGCAPGGGPSEAGGSGRGALAGIGGWCRPLAHAVGARAGRRCWSLLPTLLPTLASGSQHKGGWGADGFTRAGGDSVRV